MSELVYEKDGVMVAFRHRTPLQRMEYLTLLHRAEENVEAWAKESGLSKASLELYVASFIEVSARVKLDEDKQPIAKGLGFEFVTVHDDPNTFLKKYLQWANTAEIEWWAKEMHGFLDEADSPNGTITAPDGKAKAADDPKKGKAAKRGKKAS